MTRFCLYFSSALALLLAPVAVFLAVNIIGRNGDPLTEAAILLAPVVLLGIGILYVPGLSKPDAAVAGLGACSAVAFWIALLLHAWRLDQSAPPAPLAVMLLVGFLAPIWSACLSLGVLKVLQFAIRQFCRNQGPPEKDMDN